MATIQINYNKTELISYQLLHLLDFNFLLHLVDICSLLLRSGVFHGSCCMMQLLIILSMVGAADKKKFEKTLWWLSFQA